jgi:hypothetical protein
MQLNGLDRFFWAAGLAGNTALLFVLFYRRLAHRFPFFTSLIALNVFRTIVLYWVLHLGTTEAYFESYWSLGLLDTALQLCIVYEIALLVFRPTGRWAPDVRQRFLWLLFPSMAVALGLSLLASPPARFWQLSAVARGNLCAECLMSELFVLMLALSVSAGLPWRTHVARIAQGLGTYSIVSLIIQTGKSYFGVARDAPMFVSLGHIRMASYLVCVTYWIVTLWAEEQRPIPMPEELRRSLFALQNRVSYDLQILRSRKKW